MDELRQNQVIADELSNRKGPDCWFEGWKVCLNIGGIPFCKEPFTRSLDSCWLFEEKLSDEEWQDYALNLSFRGGGFAPINGLVAIAKATSAQRCKAFLQVVKKWEE